MTNTTRYFDSIKQFRDNLRKINAHYQPEYEHLEKFKDSEYYASSKKIIDDRRQQEVDALRLEATRRIATVVDDMERTYMERPTSAPTQEQLAILQALKMRDTVERDELRQAANALKGCPVAERVLEEIARKNGHALALSKELSSDTVRQSLQSLRRNGEKLVSKLEAPGSRGEYLNAGNYDMFRLDIDPADEADCMRVFGMVTDAPGFAAAVNTEQR